MVVHDQHASLRWRGSHLAPKPTTVPSPRPRRSCAVVLRVPQCHTG
jgi:hypothetical protein